MDHTKETPGASTTGQVAEAPTSTQNYADYTTNAAASQERIRIDFTVNDDGTTTVIKFVRRGTDRPYSSEVKPPGFDLDAALAWCRENGYYVVTWPGGARAWKDERPWVIRTTHQIVGLRARLERELDWLRNAQGDPVRRAQLMRLLQHDLAYYG
jgi:hypothetical protein